MSAYLLAAVAFGPSHASTAMEWRAVLSSLAFFAAFLVVLLILWVTDHRVRSRDASASDAPRNGATSPDG